MFVTADVVAAAARPVVDLDARTVSRWARAGKIPGARRGPGRWLFDDEQAADWLAATFGNPTTEETDADAHP